MKQKTNNQPATPSPSNTEQVEGFTPGEWLMNTTKKFVGEPKGLCITGENDKLICIVSHDISVLSIDEYVANAELIASAPQLKEENNRLKADNKILLEALKECSFLLQDFINKTPSGWKRNGYCDINIKVQSAINQNK